MLGWGWSGRWIRYSCAATVAVAVAEDEGEVGG